MYADGDNGTASRTAVYKISGTGITTTSTSLTDAANSNFGGTFTQASGSNGNYVVFSVTASNFLLTATPGTASDGTPRAPVNGIQIVPIASGVVVGPSVTTQPVSQTVMVGQTATFTVLAAGSAPLHYQWQKNGTSITGATSASYTTPPATSADNGSMSQVVVSNSAGTVTSNAAMLTVNSNAVAPTITAQPTNQTVSAGLAATFSVAATGTSPLSYQWQKNALNISGATSASYTTPVTSLGDNAEQFTVTVSNVAGNAPSTIATLTVNPSTVSTVDVITYHDDNLRTGQNLSETILTPTNVNATKFGKLGPFTVDGLVDAQPLYLSAVSIPGIGTKNVLYAATEHGSVYAFDADSVHGNTATFCGRFPCSAQAKLPATTVDAAWLRRRLA